MLYIFLNFAVFAPHRLQLFQGGLQLLPIYQDAVIQLTHAKGDIRLRSAKLGLCDHYILFGSHIRLVYSKKLRERLVQAHSTCVCGIASLIDEERFGGDRSGRREVAERASRYLDPGKLSHMMNATARL